MEPEKTTLYIVATPIGNMEDITLRALRILKEVDVVLCEDTRVTKKLLSKYEIDTPTMSYHAHSQASKHEKIIEMLREGKNLALVSDAGTPTISDPGVMLVAQVRKDLPEVDVVPIPGVSAVITALSASGIPSSEFLFLGFLPHKKGRETLFKEIATTKRTTVFYESPHRVMKTLESLRTFLKEGDGEGRVITIGRELTKIHEQIISGTAEELIVYFEDHPDKVRGEFVVVVEGL